MISTFLAAKERLWSTIKSIKILAQVENTCFSLT